jgi:hypothetical protein
MGWRAEVQWPSDVVELDAGLFALNGCVQHLGRLIAVVRFDRLT